MNPSVQFHRQVNAVVVWPMPDGLKHSWDFEGFGFTLQALIRSHHYQCTADAAHRSILKMLGRFILD